MNKLAMIALLALAVGCENKDQHMVPVRVKIISVNDLGTVNDRFATAVIELPNGRRMSIIGRFGRVGDSFVYDVPAWMTNGVVENPRKEGV